jgi:iron(III) transport system substrate-binding protein
VGGVLAVVVGVGAGPADRVVVYSALDQEFSEPVLVDFARATGVQVLPKYDLESAKTVGLANAILAENAKDTPVCDLFWNNEILHTLRLRKAGVLATIDPPNGHAIPAAFKGSDGSWFGFAARARVILVNTQLVPNVGDYPKSIRDLTATKWKGKIGIAKPLFGTTATHAVCLFDAWGAEGAKAYFRALKANDAQVLAGNKTVATAVGAGRIALGLTDTDDALGEIAAGSPVAIVYPDQAEGELGTLFIPNTLAVIAKAPDRAAAERLANFLLSPEVEAKLAAGPSGQIPLNPAVRVKAQVATPATVRPMAVDFEKAAERWDEAAAFLLEEFGGR